MKEDDFGLTDIEIDDVVQANLRAKRPRYDGLKPHEIRSYERYLRKQDHDYFDRE